MLVNAKAKANTRSVIDRIDPSYLKDIKPGCTVQLQFSVPVHKRITAKLIGYEVGKYFIVSFAEPDAWKQCNGLLFEDNEIVVRMLLEGGRGECIAFKSAIRWRGYNPINMLYLYFPEEVEKHDLRQYPRIATCIDAHLTDSSNGTQKILPLRGCIRDVSLGGCCFEYVLPTTKQGMSRRSVVLGAGKEFFLSAEVRNQRPGRESVSVGLLFNTPEDKVKALLSKLFINTDMLERKL